MAGMGVSSYSSNRFIFQQLSEYGCFTKNWRKRNEPGAFCRLIPFSPFLNPFPAGSLQVKKQFFPGKGMGMGMGSHA